MFPAKAPRCKVKRKGKILATDFTDRHGFKKRFFHHDPLRRNVVVGTAGELTQIFLPRSGCVRFQGFF